MINLVHNYPHIGSGVNELMSNLSSQILAKPELAMQFIAVEGLPEHKKIAAEWLSYDGFKVEPERVAFGASGHQLLLSTLLALTKAGDKIACDPVTYNGWLNIVRHSQRQNVVVAGDADGMLPEALDDAAKKESLWGVFLMPSLHNPCATAMSLDRRQALIEVCRRHNLWVIDDDAYRFLNPTPPPSFGHLYPERSVWLQSLTKPLFPSIKTSLMVAPTEVLSQTHETLRATAHQPSALTLPWVLQLLESKHLDQIVFEKQKEAVKRQKLAKEILTGFEFQTTPTAFHLWMHLPAKWTASSATQALKVADIGVVSGTNYEVTNPDSSRHIRIALGGESDRERLATGLLRLVEVFK